VKTDEEAREQNADDADDQEQRAQQGPLSAQEGLCAQNDSLLAAEGGHRERCNTHAYRA